MKPDLANLFTRPFWLDEWHTALVANRDSLAQVFSDLWHASDMGPPVLHVIAWSVARFGGELTPVAARSISLASVLLALLFVYLTLRRRLGLAGSTAGALAVASPQIVVAHAFELRYYCLWLTFASAFAWSLGLDRDRAISRRRDVTVAALSALLCLTHWLAAMSLGLMCLGAMAAFGRDWRAGLRRVLPAATGFVALGLGIPLVMAQRAAVVETSWMPDVTIRDVLATMSMYWGGTVLVLAVLVILVGLLRPQVKGTLKASFAATLRDPAPAALLALLALPLLMAILSTQYPAMHQRYSIVTLLGWAPLVAIAVQSVRYVGRTLLYVVLAGFIWISLAKMEFEARNFTNSANVGRRALAQACGMNLPVVFQVRHLMYPSTEGASPRWAPPRCDTRYLAVTSGTLDRMFARAGYLRRFFRFENEIARLHEGLYRYPRVSTEAELVAVPRFVLVGWDESFPIGYKSAAAFGLAVFPNHRVTRITDDLALFERR